MNKNLIAKSVAIAAGLLFLITAPGLARALNDKPAAVQARNATLVPGAQPKKDSSPQDDFDGLNYTDEQRAEINKIHRETESNKSAVVNDEKLTSDQKNAMLLGYTRMEYGRMFRTLSTEQQRKVRKRILARRAADQQVAQRKQPPQPRSIEK